MNFTNFSCIIFCAKISQYSFYTYCLQSTQFGLEVLGQFDIEKSIVYKSGVLAHFAPWGIFGLGSISTSWTMSTLYVLNFLEYFLRYIFQQNVSKSDKKDSELYQVFTHNFLCQNDKIFIKNFELYPVFFLTKCLGTSKLYTTDVLKALLSKNWFYFFFLIFWYSKIPPSFRMLRCRH